MSKSDKKKTSSYEGVVIAAFKTSKKSYNVGDKFSTKDEKSLAYLKRINKVK